jgi:hypothetical protein
MRTDRAQPGRPPDPAASPRDDWRSRLRVWLPFVVKPLRRGVLVFIVLLIVEYLVVPELVGASKDLSLLGQVNPAWLAAGVVLEAASLFCYGAAAYVSLKYPAGRACRPCAPPSPACCPVRDRRTDQPGTHRPRRVTRTNQPRTQQPRGVTRTDQPGTQGPCRGRREPRTVQLNDRDLAAASRSATAIHWDRADGIDLGIRPPRPA